MEWWHCLSNGEAAAGTQNWTTFARSRRDSKWANSALVVAVGSTDWEPWTASHGPMAGVALQVEAERCYGPLTRNQHW